jgi:hypothetical protein
MNKLAAFLFVVALCLTLFDAQGADSKDTQFLYVEVSLFHTLGGKKLRQQVAVKQDSTFTVITFVEKVRWTLSGKVGALHDGVVPVDLTVKHYVSETQNETMTAPLKLHLDKEGQGFGAIHGVAVQPSIWTKPRD